MMRTPRHVAGLDSNTSMLLALSRHLQGQDFPGTGVAPMNSAALAWAVNRLPVLARERMYRWAGWWEGVPPSRLAALDEHAIARWVVSQYAGRRVPAVMLGASNGAAMHLCAAMGVPWLPQTFLVPVRRTRDPDDAEGEMQWGRSVARPLLERNPGLHLHHMADPVQDRLMLQRMAYFRIKMAQLPAAYLDFLERVLEPGGVLVLIECGLRWPVTRLGERHVFQFGGLGGLTPEEYHRGSDRVAEFLARHGATRRAWDAPAPTEEAPEAEWGFVSTWGDALDAGAASRGWQVRRLVFEQPDDLAPLVADLYRSWYRQVGTAPNRLLVESFALVEPHWALRTRSVPFWLSFTAEASARALETYLETREPFDEIHLMLLSNGIEAIGQAPIPRWRGLVQQARRRGTFLGVDEEQFPRDFAAFVRYHTELKRQIRARYPMLPPMPIDRLDALVCDA